MWKRITKRRTLLFLAHSTVASLLPSLPTFSLFRSDVHGDTRPNQKYGVINAANLAAPRCHYDNGMQQNTYGNSRNKQRKYQRPRIVTNKKTKKRRKSGFRTAPSPFDRFLGQPWQPSDLGSAREMILDPF